MKLKSLILSSFIFAAVVLGAIRFIPWSRVNWGKLEMLPGSAITVTGQAEQDVKTQIAFFTAGITITDPDKQHAADQVNKVMDTIVKAVKDFGIDEADIQTQNLSIYRLEDDEPEILIYPPQTRSTGQGDWRANNTVEIKLRDVNQASQLADLLTASGATNVHGPRFGLDDTSATETELLADAIEDARQKASVLAQASGRKLGKVLTVSEGASQPVYRALEAAIDSKTPSAVVEPGSETVSKTVTVTFELR